MPVAQLDGRTVAWEECGSGPALVLLHAFPFSSQMWAAQREALSGRYRVITPDFAGFGRSPLQPPVSMAGYAADVLALLDHLSVLRFALVGLSMGGYVAFELLDRAPHRIAALALCDTRASADSEEGRQGREDSALAVETSGTGVLVENLMPKLLAPNASAQVRAQVEAFLRATPAEGAAAAQRAMAGRRDFTGHLDRIGCPTLVLVGEEDTLTPPAEAELLARQIPGAELKRIPGAGHLSNLEQPDAFNEALGEFLESAL